MSTQLLQRTALLFAIAALAGCDSTGSNPSERLGVIRVSVATTGVDLPNGYDVSVDGGAPRRVVTDWQSATFPELSPGTHVVALAGVTPNCTVGGPNPRSVSLAAGNTVPVAFAVTCAAVTGIVEVTAVTSGTVLQWAGYTVQLDNGPVRTLAVIGTTTFPGVGAGNHSVRLDGAATNCAIAGDNPRTVTVTTGGTTWDIARTTFEVSCAARPKSVMVTAATTGADIDALFSLEVDLSCDYYCGSLWSGTLASNGSLTFDLPPGDHWFSLSDIASNCTLAGSNPRLVTVAAGVTANVAFNLTCLATGTVRVTAPTTGSDPDPGYCVTVDGSSNSCLEAGGSLSVNLVPGSYTIELTDVAPNCTVNGANPVLVTVTADVTTDVAFPVSCVPNPTLRVTVTTTGSNLGSGYLVGVDPDYYSYAYSINVPPSGVVSIRIPPGSHWVYLDNVASNCTVTSANPVSVALSLGATVDVAFAVTCR